MHVYQNSGLAPEALAQALTPVLYEVSDFGEEVDEMKELVEVLCTMLFLMVVYFMVLIYGMQICTEVSLEKTSKLVEQLLTSVTPYGMVAGKTLAVITASIIQFLIWVISALVGLFGGDKLAGTVYPEYESKITVITDALSGWFGEMAFSPVSIILAVLILVAGLVFYLLLAIFQLTFVVFVFPSHYR
jgi:ABC-type Na+ efflux pump permease subunit